MSVGLPQHSPNDGTTIEPPPSQWIEETLIDLYLSGYSSTAVDPGSLTVSPVNELSGSARRANRSFRFG